MNETIGHLELTDGGAAKHEYLVLKMRTVDSVRERVTGKVFREVPYVQIRPDDALRLAHLLEDWAHLQRAVEMQERAEGEE